MISVSKAVFAASGLAPLALLVLAVLWVRGDHRSRGALLVVSLSIGFALALNQLFGLMWFEPRPFMIGVGHTRLSHVPDNSFPSDHATLLWSAGFALIATGASRPWGWVVVSFGGIVAWARIYLGVHFPIDMLGSASASAAAATVAMMLRSLLTGRLLDMVERIYDGFLPVLRLPSRFFPRAAKP